MRLKLFKKETLPVILLALAIGLSPSFPAGKIGAGRVIEIRAEDVLLVILGLVWLANFLISERKKIKRPPLFFPILVWLGIGFLSILTNWIFANITLSRGFFYFLKEIEFFFLYFYLFYHIKSFSLTKFILKLWLFLGLINVAWIIYEIVTGVRLAYYYGPTTFMEPRGSFPSAGFFLIIFTFLFNVLLYYYLNLEMSNFKKGILTVAILSLTIGVLSSASRANFWGLVFALPLTLFFYCLKRKKLKSVLFGLLIIALVISIFMLLFPKIEAMQRLIDLKRIPTARVWVWKAQLKEFLNYPLFLFIGLGKSVLLFAGEESHSQYVRNFIETGILGSLAFLFLIFQIIKKSASSFFLRKDPLLVGLSAGLLVSTLTMLVISIPAEAFIVVKIAETYWFFTALTMATLYLKTKEEKKHGF